MQHFGIQRFRLYKGTYPVRRTPLCHPCRQGMSFQRRRQYKHLKVSVLDEFWRKQMLRMRPCKGLGFMEI